MGEEPLTEPPEVEEGDDTEAGGGTQVGLSQLTEEELEDADELEDEDVEDEDEEENERNVADV